MTKKMTNRLHAKAAEFRGAEKTWAEATGSREHRQNLWLLSEGKKLSFLRAVLTDPQINEAMKEACGHELYAALRDCL